MTLECDSDYCRHTRHDDQQADRETYVPVECRGREVAKKGNKR